MNLLDLAVRVTVDDQASNQIAQIGEGIKSGLGTAAKVGAAAVTAVGAATTAVGGAFMGAAGDVAEYGDSIDKMSQKMGMSAESYQEWDSVMRHSGTSMEAMKASMKTLANAAETGSDAFDKLGISQEQIANMSQEELFEATITALQNVEDETQRTYLAGKTLGRGATELGALLNTSAEDTQAMRDRVHELGGVMSDEAVKAAAAYQDSLQDMQTAFGGLKNRMMSEFLPAVTTVMDGLQEVFAGNYDEGLDKISEGISGVADKMSEIMPKVMEVGGNILSALVTAISDNLPTLITAIVELFKTVTQAVIENMPTIVAAIVECLPLFIEATVQLAIALAQALVDSVPILLDAVQNALSQMAEKFGGAEGFSEKITEFVQNIGQFLADNGPAMLEAAGEFFGNILNGLSEAMPVILDGLVQGLLGLIDYVIQNGPEMLVAAGEFFLNILTALIENLPQILEGLFNALGDLIGGIIERIPDILAAAFEFWMGLNQAIADALPDILAGLGNLLSQAVDSVGGFVGDMLNAGANLIQGLIDGIAGSIGGVVDTITGGVADAIASAKSMLGIASPSKIFKELGGFTMEGFAIGIEANAEDAEKAMQEAADAVYGAASGTVDVGIGYAQTVPQNGYQGVLITGNEFVVRSDDDIPRIAEAISTLWQRQMDGQVA